MARPLRVLIAEDNPDDAVLILAELRRAGFEPEWRRVDGEVDYLEGLHSGLDVVLSDYEMPQFNGLRALALLKQSRLDVPFIIVSGAIGEEIAVAAMKFGAADYLIKDRMGRLGAAVTHALAERQWRSERQQAEELLQRRQSELRVFFDLMPAMVWFKDMDNRILRVNRLAAESAGKTVEEIEGKPSLEIYPQDAAKFYADDLEVIHSGNPKLGIVERLRSPGGDDLWVQTDKVPVRDQNGKIIGIVVLAQDITERKRSEAALEKIHEQLVESSRQAGMAEIATGILHNVGNVLNSVGIASTCVADSLKKSKATNLAKVVTLLRAHEGNLGTFLTSDPKGKRLPDYLAQLSEHLVAEQETALKELAQLQKNIEHIKEIVSLQQGTAKGSGGVETLQVADLLEDTLRMASGGVPYRDIEVISQFEAGAVITVERHKTLQILTNLVRNAKQACDEKRGTEKRLTLRVTQGKNRVQIAVIDDGVGISPENLMRVFARGFTTKKDGHGYGLHSAAAAAKEMGGALTVHSDGVGHGATFTLELPPKA